MIRRFIEKLQTPKKAQLELSIQRVYEPDRNHRHGGRSFYFFDFDDNVAYLSTPMYIFHKTNNEELKLTTEEWSAHSHNIGFRGPYKDFRIESNDRTGSYRRFRDDPRNLFHRIVGKKQNFVEDLAEALKQPDYLWKGPSWHCFYHAVFNQRPLSIITARGHAPETIREGIELMVKLGHLPHSPNYLAIYPVSHTGTRHVLNDKDLQMTVPQLKKAAIRASVEKAFEIYGKNPYHRFGMSDDDPKNLDLITEEMKVLKQEHPKVSFFIINTHAKAFIKQEVFTDETKEGASNADSQLTFF